MIINDIPVNADLSDILYELRAQLKANGVNLLKDIKDTPNNIMVTCPYHKNGQERKPSAGLRKLDGQFHCFTCGEVHELQEVISHCFGRHDDMIGAFGWNWILKNFLTVKVEERKDVSLDFSRGPNRAISDVPKVTEEELDSYRVYHPYMWRRRMTPKVVDIFDIGYDEKTQSITFPVRDRRGVCLFVARRSVNTKFFNYPEGVTKPLYGLYELYQLDKFPNDVIVCESMIDAITCWVYGKYAVALNGLGNSTQMVQLSQMPCRHLILATDNDEAGRMARKRIRKYVRGKIITQITFPEGKKDINDLTKEEFDSLEEIF